MGIEGGDREDDQHHVMRSTHPYLSYEVDTPKEVTGLRSGSMEDFLHSPIQSSIDEDVSSSGDISPRGPVDQ